MSRELLDRRTFVKGTGVALGGAALAGEAGARTGISDALDVEGGLQEAIVVFSSKDAVGKLGELDLSAGHYEFQALPFGYTKLTGPQLAEVAGWSEVEYVQDNHDVELHNDDARDVTGAETVQEELFYTGESVHAVVIDSGIDGDHPDFAHNLQHNFRFQNPLEGTMWRDVGPVDTSSQGHGTHVSGAVCGGGQASDGQLRGMAPDADLTVYSTDAVISLLNIVGAYDDVIARQRAGKHDVQVINNSYGANAGSDYNPTGSLQRATWEAYQLGMVSVFSAGNSGPGSNTMGNYASGPHIMSSAATNDRGEVTDFSSRGRKPGYEGLAPPEGDGANYDRKAALENLEAYYSKGFTSPERVVAGKGDTRTGTLGVAGTGLSPVGSPVEEPDSPASGSVFEKIDAHPKAGFAVVTVGWDPDGADNDIYLRKGAKDGPIVGSSTGFVNANPETIRAPVEEDTDYFLELRPFANVVAQYEMTYRLYDVPDSEVPDRPYGVHRPAVGTPGNLTVSTLAPDDAHQTYAGQTGAADKQLEVAQEPYYGALSGTSMSAPGLTGIVALVFDAYRQNHDTFPDPMDVINTVEATAERLHDGHTTFNVGAGFVRAHEAVKLAEAGDMADFSDVELVGAMGEGDNGFTATGTRTDDGAVFTAGQTNQVTIDVDATDTALVRERVPFDWKVLDGDYDRVVTERGERFLVFESVPADGSVSYFVEAPSSSGEYTFGPAEAHAVGGSNFLTLTGADTNRVVGVDQNTL